MYVGIRRSLSGCELARVIVCCIRLMRCGGVEPSIGLCTGIMGGSLDCVPCVCLSRIDMPLEEPACIGSRPSRAPQAMAARSSSSECSALVPLTTKWLARWREGGNCTGEVAPSHRADRNR